MTSAPAIAIGHDMAGDREEPASKAVVPFSRPELANISQGVGKDLTGRILGVRPVVEPDVTEADYRIDIVAVERTEGGRIALGRCDKHVLTLGQCEPVS
jgi:hypothetical protein